MINNKKLQINVVTLILLCVALSVTSFAIAATMIRYEIANNYFQTGEIKIDLNGGKPIIPADDKRLLQPGNTIKQDFTIANRGGWKVHYKLFFDKVEGKLGDVLYIKIYKKEQPDIILLEGNMKDLVDANKLQIASTLEKGEEQILVASFHFPEEAGNEYGGEMLEFDMSAIAVQTKNNPEGKFE